MAPQASVADRGLGQWAGRPEAKGHMEEGSRGAHGLGSSRIQLGLGQNGSQQASQGRLASSPSSGPPLSAPCTQEGIRGQPRTPLPRAQGRSRVRPHLPSHCTLPNTLNQTESQGR